jgi:uncharacterized membrane protein YraQ (UPF0718 family)
VTSQISAAPSVNRSRAVGLTLVALAVAAIGLAWAKWLPYADRAAGIAGSGHYPGKSLLAAGAGQGPFERAFTFTSVYTQAVWKALLVALIISACVDVLVPRRWLLRVLGRRTPLGASIAGGLAALPGMMCTCCTAPLAVTLRRVGVPTSAALAFWLGNPVLNPAVLIFLGLLAPPSWVAVRIGVGVVLVIGVSTLLGHLVARQRKPALLVGAGASVPGGPTTTSGASAVPQPDLPPDLTLRELPSRLLRSFARLAIILVPEYLLVVFLVGLVGEPLGRVLGQGGALAVVIAAVVGTLLVLPTGGEVPIVLGLAAAGASSGVLGALLIALPAFSLPAAAMVGQALGWRVTAATALATAVLAVIAGGALTLLS